MNCLPSCHIRVLNLSCRSRAQRCRTRRFRFRRRRHQRQPGSTSEDEISPSRYGATFHPYFYPSISRSSSAPSRPAQTHSPAGPLLRLRRLQTGFEDTGRRSAVGQRRGQSNSEPDSVIPDQKTSAAGRHSNQRRYPRQPTALSVYRV